MNNIRKILNVKFIMIIALATLFISATSIMQAHASGFSWAKCPCNFWSALHFAKKVAAKINGHFEIEECTDDGDELEASGENDCRIELEAEDGECGYEFQCGELEDEAGEIDVEADGFALAFDIAGLTDAEFEACRREIKLISMFIFRVHCESNSL